MDENPVHEDLLEALVNLNEVAVDGKNTSIQITDFINEHNKETVIIYGNKISEEMMSTG